MIHLDGSFGEGGGQILRTALSLSLATGIPFQIENIRAGRKHAGLLRQHLTAVRAAAEIGEAEVDGAVLGSAALTFAPKTIRGGEYRFAIGTAGSATLVFQTILPALLRAETRSRVTIEGGIVRALFDADARFLIVGAYAVNLHVDPRATGDLDIWVEASPENAGKVLRALEDFGKPTPSVCR